MNIQAEKLRLIEWLLSINDRTVIERLRKIKDDYSDAENSGNELKKEEIESLKKGLKDIRDGRVHAHEVARRIYGKYL